MNIKIHTNITYDKRLSNKDILKELVIRYKL